MKPRLGDVVEVEWLDAWVESDALDPLKLEEHRKTYPIKSYGVLVRDLPEVVSIAPEYNPERRHRDTVHIPRGMVLRVRTLESGEGRK